MPAFKETLAAAELDAVLAYLRMMAEHKVCGVDRACE
jgi:mono/diheme cytochrome c family protein